jgi:hypothetical protein
MALSALNGCRSVSCAAFPANLHVEPVFLGKSLFERVQYRHLFNLYFAAESENARVSDILFASRFCCLLESYMTESQMDYEKQSLDCSFGLSACWYHSLSIFCGSRSRKMDRAPYLLPLNDRLNAREKGKGKLQFLQRLKGDFPSHALTCSQSVSHFLQSSSSQQVWPEAT